MPHAPIVSIDPSWIPWFQKQWHDCVEEFLLPFPVNVVARGFLGSGGDFEVNPAVRPRMHAVGWLDRFAVLPEADRAAVRTRYRIQPDHLVALMYPSRQNGFDLVRDSLEAALPLLIEQLEGRRLTILLAQSPGSRWPEPVQGLPWLPHHDFDRLCAAADVVVATGFGATAAKSLRSGVPVILWSLPWNRPYRPWDWGQREAHVAWTAGLVQRLCGNAAASAVATSLYVAMTNEVLRREQLRAASDPVDGVAVAVERIEACVRARRCRSGAWPR